MAQHSFQLDLFQVARVHTETFTVEADDEKQAKAMADQIAKDKGLSKDFDWQIKDISAQASAGATEPAPAVQPTEPSEPEPR